MRTIIVDDDAAFIERFRMEAKSISGLDIVGEFRDPMEALSFVEKSKAEGESKFDLALLDIVMPGINGIKLMGELRKMYPKMVIFFISSHDEYAAKALRMKIDYYIFKPFESEDLEDCAQRARLLARRENKRMLARTFGRFDLFVDGRLVMFRNAKAKELLALCVDQRGGEVTMEMAIDRLWEDREYDSRVKQSYRTAVMQLKATLNKYNAVDLFKTRRGACCIDANIINCDLYDLLDEKEEAIRKFDYIYMMEYSWAEETLGSLFERFDP